MSTGGESISANWVFVFQVLAPLWTQPPQGMDPRTKATLAEADQVLAGLWRAAQAMVGAAPSISAPRAARVSVGGGDALVVCMPGAYQSPDAYFVLGAEIDGRWRCITLERLDHGDGAMLAEAFADGSHGSYGVRGGPATLPAFLEHCSALLGVAVELAEGPVVRRGVTKTPDWVWLLAMSVVAAILVALTFLI